MFKLTKLTMDILLIYKIITFFAVWIAGVVIGWYIPDKKHPKPFSLLDFYPFICRKCLTTWLLLILYAVGALLLSDWIFGVLGAIMTAMTGFALWYTDNERMENGEGNRKNKS